MTRENLGVGVGAYFLCFRLHWSFARLLCTTSFACARCFEGLWEGGAGRYKILCFNQAILGYSTKWAQVKTVAALRRRNLSCNLDYFAKGGGKSKKKEPRQPSTKKWR